MIFTDVRRVSDRKINTTIWYEPNCHAAAKTMLVALLTGFNILTRFKNCEFVVDILWNFFHLVLKINVEYD